ncbi:MAG TPA: histidine kinase [Solirubrobacteraceae bacterium]|nr:histidine kinase [Solirubrobacteraceae bacterium]
MRRPPLLDLAIAAVLVLWAVMEAALLSGEGSTAERIGWALGFTAPLALRRQFPVAVAVAIAATVAARVLVADGGTTQEEGAMPLPAILLAAFTAAAHARRLESAVAAGLALAAAVGTAVSLTYYEGTAEPSDGAILGFFVLAAWGAGWFVRRRGTIAAQQAVLEERARIARELHDIIGHSVSVISLQAGAAEQLVAKDPEKAATHLRAVRETAHQALVEMRRLMGVLKEDEADYAPQPGLHMLDELVARSGLDVEVVREGERRDVAPGVDLAAYRIVQEALTNARKHGGAKRARVRIGYEDDAVGVEVTNPLGRGTNGEGGGQGLVGMRERARLFGGTLEAGPEGDAFTVRARLPA